MRDLECPKNGSSKNKAPYQITVAMFSILAIGLGACSSSSSDSMDEGNGESTDTFTVGGEVTGVEDGALNLTLNEDDSLSIEQDGSFTFDTELESGEEYSIAIEAAPSHHSCSLENASGEIAEEDVDDVVADCQSLNLSAVNRERAVELDWQSEETVAIAFSSDFDCDWHNYSNCPDSGMITDLDGGNLTLDEGDGLQPGKRYSFVKVFDDAHSAPVVATPMIYTLSGPVFDTALNNDSLFAAGDFRRYHADAANMLRVRHDMPHADITGALNDFSASGLAAVSQVADLPDGGWIVAGLFDTADGQEIANLAKIRPDGSIDTDFQVHLDGSGYIYLETVEVDDERIYIGGRFASVNGDDSYSNLAVLHMDGSLDTAFSPLDLNGRVDRVIAHEDRLFFSGFFSDLGNAGHNGIAAVDRESGEIDEDFSVESDGNVLHMEMLEDGLLIAGDFGEIGGIEQGFAAIVDPQSGAMNEDFRPKLDDTAWGSAATGERIYLAGLFTDAGESGQAHLAAFERGSGALEEDFTPHLDDNAYSLEIIDDKLYVAGRFSNLGYQGIEAFGRMDLSSGEVDSEWDPGVLKELYGWDFHINDNDLMLLGIFHGGDGREVNHLAKLDLDTGQLLSDWNGGTDGPIHSITLSDDVLYVGGDFSEAYSGDHDNPHAYATAFDANDGSSRGWQPQPDNPVHALAMSDDEDSVILGGEFTTVKGMDYDRVARVDIQKGDPLPNTENPEVNGPVYDVTLKPSSNAITIGGEFDDVEGFDRDNAALLDVNDLNVRNFTPNPNAPVWATVLNPMEGTSESRLYFGGEFTEVAEESQMGFASIDGNSNLIDGTPTANEAVRAIDFLESENRLLIGGDFTEFGGEERSRLAVLSVDSDDLSVTESQRAFDERVRSISQTDDRIVLGGDFRYSEGDAHRYLILLDAATMEALWAAPDRTPAQAEHPKRQLTTPQSHYPRETDQKDKPGALAR